MNQIKQGVLLINLGTPEAPDVKSVRKFLREFLSDPKVIDLPWIVRQLILNCFILPFRPKQTAKLYQKIWTEQGSPLLYHSQEFCERLARSLGGTYQVELGMRYGKPSLRTAAQKLAGCDEIIVLPLFPQYSVAASDSAISACKAVMAKITPQSRLNIIASFFDNPAYVKAMAHLLQKSQVAFNPDFILFSYHGIPERALEKSGCSKGQCDRVGSCVAQANNAAFCYRAQCEITSHAIAQQLQLPSDQYGFAFQSRLGRAQWVRPYTDEVLADLRRRKVERLLVACPSFVADCLETLEEINLRLKQQWLAAGGASFAMVPCLNAEDVWVKAAASILTSAHTSC